MTTHFEDEICPVCNGSGEGMTERSNCYNCNGTGCVWVEVNDEQETEDERLAVRRAQRVRTSAELGAIERIEEN